MQIRTLCFALVAALAFAPLAARGAQEAEEASYIPDFSAEGWEMEEVRPRGENPSFTVTFYGLWNKERTIKEGGMTLQYGGITGEVVLKAWGIIFENGWGNPREGFNALHLGDGKWAVSKQGEGFDWRTDSSKEGNYFVLLVFTENGPQGRAFEIKHVM